MAALLFVPLNVLTSRLQIQGIDPSKALYPYENGRGRAPLLSSKLLTHLDAVRSVWRTEGIKGFYRGLGSSLVMDVPCSAISWLTYENLKRVSVRDKYDSDVPKRFVKYFNDHQIVYHSIEATRQLIITLSGTLAGGFAATLTNPIAMATVRVQGTEQKQPVA